MQKLNSAMTTAVLLLCVSASVVRADESGDESSVAAMVKSLVALTDTLKAKTDQHAHVQLTTGGEVVELVSAAHVKALEKQIEECARRDDAQDAEMEKQIEECARRGDAQDAEIGTAVAAVSKMREELKEGCVPCGERGHQLIRESGVTQAKLAAQEAKINELSATVAQFLVTSGAQDAEIGTMREELKSGRAPSGERGDQLTRELDATKARLAAQEARVGELSATVAQLTATPQARPMPVDAAGTAAARRLQDAGSLSSPLPSCTHPSFDFETDAIDSCPQAWTCAGSASVQSEASAACGVTGVTGSHFFSVGCDGSQLGSAVSSAFFLPLSVATMRFQRQGGADSPSGLYMFVAATDTLIAQSNEGSDVNQMFEVTLSLSAHAGETVYIEVKDEESGGWGKVGYDAFRFYDAQGLLLDDSCMFSGPLPPSPNLPPSPPPSPPAWPPLPATANELRMAGRHTAIAFNTGVDGIEAYRCVGVADGKLTCSGELRAANFRTASGISLEGLAQFTGMVPPSPFNERL